MSDHTESKALEQGMLEAAYKLNSMVDEVALARQVMEFGSERRRTLLARFAAPMLDSGRSQPQSESLARASDEYRSELEQLEKQSQHAHRIDAKWRAVQCIYEARRSALSAQKESMRVLQG